MAHIANCQNMNHSRQNAPIRFCPMCGEKLNSKAHASCDDAKHGARRKDRDTYCCDCGKKIREENR